MRASRATVIGVCSRAGFPVAALALLLAACVPHSCNAPRPAAKEYVATDGAIAVQNLEGAIEEGEKAHARSPQAPQFVNTLVGLLLMRAQFLGRLDDYLRAEQLADRAVQLGPEDPRSYLLRASVRSALHRFDDAEADLMEAERRGASGDALIQPRAAILHAKGRLRESLELWGRLASPDIMALGSYAVSLAESGDRNQAEQLFDKAKRSYGDVSPFPLAWIEFQRGLLWERGHELSRARERYEAARAYLPRYAPATGHLASVLITKGELSAAVELLRALVEDSDDPEYKSQLATALLLKGKLEEAAELRKAARWRYDALADRHPEAFSDHAARFWLGEDPAKALALARRSLAVRQTADGLELALTAALAARDDAAACDIADQALSSASTSQRIKALTDRAYGACGRRNAVHGQPAAARGPAGQ